MLVLTLFSLSDPDFPCSLSFFCLINNWHFLLIILEAGNPRSRCQLDRMRALLLEVHSWCLYAATSCGGRTPLFLVSHLRLFLLESLLLHPLLPSFPSFESLLHSLFFILILSILLQVFELYPLFILSHIDITCISCFWCFVLIVSMLVSIFSLSLLLLFQSGISSKSLKYPQGGDCPLNPKDFASLHRTRVCEPHHAGFCSLKQMSSVGIPMPPMGC